eukprot:TRINITY_DN54494_c0_g1_i1.p1 TRINITY_DN54494_c0_g1~~TRINITY_DN54494_c0_g1_i1.p1  ORF type:complete len:277 (-),score=64.19 TRINITY_DN54494_c0_g1_i1:65-895(-)
MPPMSALPIAKFAGILVRQASKPISVRLQSYAENHPVLRGYCVELGQTLHAFSARVLRQSQGIQLEYIVDQPQTYAWAERPSVGAAEMRTLQRESALALLRKGRAVDVLSSPEGAFQQVKWKETDGTYKTGWIPKTGTAWYSGPTLRSRTIPLPSEEALKNGTSFISEAFIFSVAAAWLLYELTMTSKDSKQKAATLKADMERRDAAIEELKRRSDEAAALQEAQLKDVHQQLVEARAEAEAARAESERGASAARRASVLAGLALLYTAFKGSGHG